MTKQPSTDLPAAIAEATRLKDELFTKYPENERWRTISDVDLPMLLEKVRSIMSQSVAHSSRTSLDKNYRNLVSVWQRQIKQRLDQQTLPSEDSRQRLANALFELVTSFARLANDPSFPPRDSQDLELVQAIMRKAGEVFAQRNVPVACPRCGTEDWSADVYGSVVARLPVSGGFPIPPPYVPVLTTTCKNCGYIAMHNLSVLGIEL